MGQKASKQKSAKASSVAVVQPLNLRVHMKNDCITDEEIKARSLELKRILDRVKPESIRAGVEAYKRELPVLLKERREGFSVAYLEGERIEIAPTRVKLQELLDAKRLASSDGLYVARVTATDIDDYGLDR